MSQDIDNSINHSTRLKLSCYKDSAFSGDPIGRTNSQYFNEHNNSVVVFAAKILCLTSLWEHALRPTILVLKCQKLFL